MRREILSQMSLARARRYFASARWNRLQVKCAFVKKFRDFRIMSRSRMSYTYQYEGLTLKRRCICTMKGKPIFCQARFGDSGSTVPGDGDHVHLLGPVGVHRAGARGVITFDVPRGHWTPERWHPTRTFVFFFLLRSRLSTGCTRTREDAEHEMRKPSQHMSRTGRQPYNGTF